VGVSRVEHTPTLASSDTSDLGEVFADRRQDPTQSGYDATSNGTNLQCVRRPTAGYAEWRRAKRRLAAVFTGDMHSLLLAAPLITTITLAELSMSPLIVPVITDERSVIR
jgi:hypothetical protein